MSAKNWAVLFAYDSLMIVATFLETSPWIFNVVRNHHTETYDFCKVFFSDITSVLKGCQLVFVKALQKVDEEEGLCIDYGAKYRLSQL